MGGLKPLCKTLQPNKKHVHQHTLQTSMESKMIKKKVQDQIIDFNWSCIPVKKKNTINNLVQVSSKTEMSLPLNEML